MQKHNCPICKTDLMPFERYPKYICESCAKKATDAKGRMVEFGNTSICGGFEGYYLDTKEAYNSHTCYIDGTECYAEEARFGGIVIQTLRN